MFALPRNALIGFNLYCGGGTGPGGGGGGGGGPASPGGTPAPPSPSSPPPPLLSGPAAPSPFPAARGAPCSLLIGSAAAPRSLIGSAAPRSPPLWSPEEELDGCEPEAELGGSGGGVGGGSLPGTPPELPADELRQDSLELILRYLREAAGETEPGLKKFLPGLLGRPGGTGDGVMEKALETLRRVGDGVLEKHELAFQGMLRKLEIKKEEDLQAVGEVAAHLFSDGVTNWGRVVTLISFGAFVARHLKSVKQEKSIGSLARIITDALVSSKREWLMSQGGWEGFVDFFRVEDLEGSIRNVLMAFAGVAGLGASLAYMIR
ncbi:induced myeloid leukemia cell differentiation protein Mcl-1 [Anas platyrhynchos]|uniref:induced myeloid leukemia cell differentiation protein Mcl-1 n=1 Tax=Anas platyrhynchos TaxID=8839 RepID=UPI003AF26FA2